MYEQDNSLVEPVNITALKVKKEKAVFYFLKLVLQLVQYILKQVCNNKDISKPRHKPNGNKIKKQYYLQFYKGQKKKEKHY